MHFRPVDRLEDEDYLGQGGGGGPANVTEEADPDAGGLTSFTLDDVFGAEAEPDPTSQEMPESPGHPSDMHRLETEHETAGYRDGIAAGREQTVQAGFDDGFNIGSALGLAAGQLLGMMEGIEEALQGKQEEDLRRNAAVVSEFLKEAEEELNEVYLLSDQFWGPQGLWSDEVDLSRLVGAHPMIIKWSNIVRDLARLVNLDLLALFAYLTPEAADDNATAAADNAITAADNATTAADNATAAGTGTATLALRPHASLDW